MKSKTAIIATLSLILTGLPAYASTSVTSSVYEKQSQIQSSVSQITITYQQQPVVTTHKLNTLDGYLPLGVMVDVFNKVGIHTYLQGNKWIVGGSHTPIKMVKTTSLPLVFKTKNETKLVPSITQDDIQYISIGFILEQLRAFYYKVTWNGKTLSITKTIIEPHHIVNPNQVYSYVQMTKDLMTLKEIYPHLIHVHIEGKTVYGRNLYAVSIGYGKATALIDAAHHAREWMTSNLAMEMIDQYAYAYKKGLSIDGYHVRDVLNKTTLWVMPMVNPDGVTLAQFGDQSFPKRVRASLVKMNHGSTNFTDWKANAQGIDPNRQYPAGWSTMPRIVNHPWFHGYQGNRPFQINEVQAVLKLVKEINPADEISYHASGDQIYWGYKVSPQNKTSFLKFAEMFGRLTGYTVCMPSGVQQGGGMTDWWTHDLKKPGLTIEIGPPEGTHPVPLQYFPSVWNQNKGVGLMLAMEAYHLQHQSMTTTV